MTNTNRIEPIAQTTAHLKNRFVAGYYALTIVTGVVILFMHGRLAFAADLLAALFYLVATALLYDLSRQKPRTADSRKGN